MVAETDTGGEERDIYVVETIKDDGITDEIKNRIFHLVAGQYSQSRIRSASIIGGIGLLDADGREIAVKAREETLGE